MNSGNWLSRIFSKRPVSGENSHERGSRFPIVAAVILFALLGMIASVSVWADFLWYREDAGHPEVFKLVYLSRSFLFAITIFPLWALFAFAFRKIFQYTILFGELPNEQLRMIANVVQFLGRNGKEAVRFGSPVLAIFLAIAFSENWMAFQMATHAQSFGQKDPLFGLDYGFYVFMLPWLHDLADLLLRVLMIVIIVLGALQWMITGLSKLARVDLGRRDPYVPLLRWIGIFGLTITLQLVLSWFGFGQLQQSQFSGAGYSGVIELRATEIFTFAVFLLSASTIIFAARPNRLRVLGGGFATCAVIGLLGVQAVPSLVQRLYVEPDKVRVETPYAERALAATRYAYGLDVVDGRDVTVDDEPTPTEVQDAQTTFQNMRLWDPNVLRQAFIGLQGLKPYYNFLDVDVDRYPIANSTSKPEQTIVMLSPRDINVDGLSENARTWVNTRLSYTHGYGLVVSPVNESNQFGQPVPLVRDIPVVAPPELKIDEPRTYFSDYRDQQNAPAEDYKIVDTRVDEFDYPSQTDSAFVRWKGARGIAINNFFRRVGLSLFLGDGNLLVSSNITDRSRILLHRSVLDRAAKIYPFLKFGDDPYLVVADGRLDWIIEGFTTTDAIPYSEPSQMKGEPLNYIRNSVKVVIDAYSGEATAYAIDPADPLLKSYRSVYPGLVQDASAIPASIRSHLRYAEDLFNIQTAAMTTYHVADAKTFLENGDAWSISNQRGLNGESEPLQPYFVQMRLPDEPKEEFLLMRPFSPYGKDNMSGWLAAHCDGDQYGKLTLYRFSKGSIVYGPAQLENLFVQDPAIANINRQFNNDQSQIVVGNLLVIPIGKSFVYAESLFLQSKTSGIQAIPELKKVILADKKHIVVGDTYAEAYEKLFGRPLNGAPTSPNLTVPPSSPAQPDRSSTGTSSATEVSAAKVKEAVELLGAADAALRKGDFSTYGEDQKKARGLLEELLKSQSPHVKGK